MEKIVNKKEKMNYTLVPTGEYYDDITYRTIDGKDFQDEKYAIRWENSLKLKALQVEFNLPEVGDYWYFPRDEEELQFLKKSLNDWCDTPYKIEDLRVGEWFTVYHFDGGDGRGYDKFITLKSLQKDIKELTELLKFYENKIKTNGDFIMADFCQECSIKMFGKDFGDLATDINDDQMVRALCEGCGFIWVDKDGKRIDFEDEE